MTEPPATSSAVIQPRVTEAPAAAERDPFEVRLVRRAAGLLRQFNHAGVIAGADVHVARQLARLTGESDEAVLLAVALAVRGPRLGHVHVDLSQIRETAAVDADEPVDLAALDWPEPEAWIRKVASSPLVNAQPAVTEPARPLRLDGAWLYLDRYWAEEVQVARSLRAMADRPAPRIDRELLRDGVGRLFADDPDGRQSQAAEAAVRRRFAVIAGGPGTGKTTTVAGIVALLGEQAHAARQRFPLVALAAPTGKAAARLAQAVHDEAGRLDVTPEIRDQLRALPATTVHRLLGWRPGSNSRFRHDRNRRLPHDVVIVDETSMVSLSLMARLIEALRSGARLVLVGDPGQLASIEAGAVLGDIVGPAAREGQPGIVVLDRVHRFGGGIARLASAIRSGDGDRVIALLRDPPEGISWLEGDVAAAPALGEPREPARGGLPAPTPSEVPAPGLSELREPALSEIREPGLSEIREPALSEIREPALSAARTMLAAARDGQPQHALEALGGFRILCAHRRGPYGVSTWTARIESWLAAEVEDFDPSDRWYPGRPLLINENDYELRLNNGDTGVVVRAGEDRVAAAFLRGAEIIEHSPARLGPVDTVYAMTIHKSQGSQFDAAAVLLPEPGSRILTRELLYTAATRARRRLILAGTEEAVRAAVARPVARASGLGRRLWGDQPEPSPEASPSPSGEPRPVHASHPGPAS